MSLKRQARQLAQLQYAPEIQALLGLKHDARSTYNTEVAQAIATAAGLKQGAKEARAPTRRVYGEAEGTRRAANQLAANTLSALPADSPFRAAFGIEDAGARTRFGEARAGALHELTQRMLEADAGRAYDISAAGQHRRESLSKIGQQLVGVRGQQGLAYATQLAGLRSDRAKQQHQALMDSLALQRFRLDRKKYYHPNSAAGGKLTKDKAGVLALSVLGARPIQRAVRPYHGVTPARHITPAQQGSAVSQLHIALQTISGLRRVPSATLRGYLTTGYTTKPTYKKGKKVPGTGGTKIPKISGAGPISSHDIINAAFDIARFGALSTPNRNVFRGVKLPRSWTRKLRTRRVRLPGIPGSAVVRAR